MGYGLTVALGIRGMRRANYEFRDGPNCVELRLDEADVEVDDGLRPSGTFPSVGF